MHMSKSQRRTLRFMLLMIGPAVVVLLALNVYPLATAIHSSFHRIHFITREMTWVGLKFYQEQLADPEFWDAVWNSIIWTLGGVVLQVVLGILLAMLLHVNFRGRLLARGVILWPYVVPTVVIAALWRFMLNPLTGIVNYIFHDLLGIFGEAYNWLGDAQLAMLAAITMGVWKFVPFMIIMFLARLQTTPLELHDAAKIDGANAWQEFRYVTLPWLRPTIIIAVLLRTMWLFKEFDSIFLLTGGGPSQATRTLPLLIHYVAFQKRHMGEAAAVSMLMLVLFLPLAFLYLRNYQKSEEDITR